MKPLHAGLLVLGATLAGAMAFWMTQQPAIPDPPPLARLNPTPPVTTPASVVITEPKPSPLGAPTEKFVERVPAVETAPAPIYSEPKPKAVVIPAAPRSIPGLNAKLSTSPVKLPPTQWAPTQYQASPEKPEGKPESKPAEAAPKAEPAPVSVPAPRQVTLQTGMTVAVRLSETISSSGATPGDIFQCTIAEPLVVDRLVIAERGARAIGRVVDAERGVVSLALNSIYTSDGQRVAVLSDPWTQQTERSFFRRAATVTTGTVIRFRLSNRVTVTEQIAAR